MVKSRPPERKCVQCGKPSYGRRCRECFKKETSPSKKVSRVRKRYEKVWRKS